MTIAACTRLVICNLANCYLTDISAFHSSVNLLKLDLSCNHVRSYEVLIHFSIYAIVQFFNARSLVSIADCETSQFPILVFITEVKSALSPR